MFLRRDGGGRDRGDSGKDGDICVVLGYVFMVLLMVLLIVLKCRVKDKEEFGLFLGFYLSTLVNS